MGYSWLLSAVIPSHCVYANSADAEEPDRPNPAAAGAKGPDCSKLPGSIRDHVAEVGFECESLESEMSPLGSSPASCFFSCHQAGSCPMWRATRHGSEEGSPAPHLVTRPPLACPYHIFCIPGWPCLDHVL